MKKIYMFIVGALMFVGAAIAIPAQASTGVTFNDNAVNTDCPTVMVGNFTQGTQKTNYCWPTQVSANPGDVVNAIIYYHNTSPDNTAHNVVVKLSPQGSSGTSNITFSGSVTSADGGYASGSGNVSISSSQTLTFGAVRAYKDQSSTGYLVSNGSDIFSSGGLNIGDIPGYKSCTYPNAFCHQGWIVVSFTVGNTVVPPPQQCTINSFYANPTTVAYGASSTLAWTTTGASSVSISGIGTQNASGSTITNALYSSQNYNLVANCNNGTQVAQSVTVTVNPQVVQQQCVINSFYANPSQVTYGGTSTLAWSTTGATGVNISGQGYQSANGSWTTGAIYGTQTYTLTANCTNGSIQTQTVTVTATQQPVITQCYINSFYATPSSVAYGSTATLYWTTSGASSVNISGYGSQSSNGSWTTSAIYGTQTYTLTANCSSGNVVSQTVTVSAAQQQIVAPITTPATNITNYSARLNGLMPAATNLGSVSAYFEYGTTTNLGQQTSPQAVSTGSYTNFFDTISTSPNTTYYFRAAATVNGTVVRGQILSFVTPAVVTTTTTTVTRPVVVVSRGTTVATSTNIGFGSPLIQLSINDQFQSVAVGNMVNYTITWHNISNQVLSNAVLNVVLPAGVTFQQASQGLLTTNNTVVANIGTLPLDASGTMTIQAVVDQTVVPGSNLVATATLAFTTPNNAQDSAIAYDVDTVGAQSQLAGLALFGGGFFPSTLLGWVLLLAIIIILILVARHYTRPRLVQTTTVQSPDYMHPGAPRTTTTTTDHFIDHLPH